MSIRENVFYLFRRHDIELAECFIRRCPDLRNIAELNTFFHSLFAQMENVDTSDARSWLEDNLTLEEWVRRFETLHMPLLKTYRFPPMTGNHLVAFYGPTQRVCPA